MTDKQKKLIEKHNAKMKIINNTAKHYNLSPMTLYMCAAFGTYGINWQINNPNP